MTTYRKDARRWQRLVEKTYALEAQQAKAPCSGCAMRDPYAMIADPGMAHKLMACLSQPATHQFWCHEGLPLGGPSGTSYQPPLSADGTIDTAQLTPCGGFLRWAVRYQFASLVEQTKAVLAFQLRMVTRFLASDHPDAAQFQRYPPVLVQAALNIQSLRVACKEEVSS